ncbi:MAG: energy-coupling factor transporter transmembrane protein EcfT [Firmicutes bacterium]|nr:energy-coupling factor transporter transmembrane protein EcfT [Bacillota bacterium]
MKDISLGQYYPIKSPVHRLDPRTKMIAVILYIITLFLIPMLPNYINNGGTLHDYLIIAAVCYGLIFILLIVAILFSRVPILRVLKSIKGILFLLIFMSLISMFFYGGPISEGSWQWSWWNLNLSTESLINAGIMSLRLVLLILGPTILTLTTTPTDLTAGIESLMSPLKLIKFPVRIFALIMSLALSLIPGLMDETAKIINAQKSRGAHFDSRNLFKKAKAMMPILIPLFISAFKRADDLANAMDSRCFNSSKKRTKMKRLSFKARDLSLLLFVASLIGIIVYRGGLYMQSIMIGGIVLGGVAVVFMLFGIIESVVLKRTDG